MGAVVAVNNKLQEIGGDTLFLPNKKNEPSPLLPPTTASNRQSSYLPFVGVNPF